MRPHPNSLRNATLLYKLYIEQELSSIEIGKQLGINDRLVRAWLYKFDIPTRSHKRASQISAPKYLSKHQLVSCPACGKQFQAHSYRLQKGKPICCSMSCSAKANEGAKKTREAFMEKHPTVTKVCLMCGSPFSVVYARRDKAKYCSASCRGAAQMLALARKKAPTGPEQIIINLAQKYFPELKYNGHGELGVVLKGLVPDFVNVNGKKQVIEVFGDYYHNLPNRSWKASELGRRMAYNSLGYRCLVLWENEIKAKPEQELVETIRKFTKSKRR